MTLVCVVQPLDTQLTSTQARATIEKHWPKAEWDALIQGVVSEVCGAADVQGNSEKLDALSVQMRESEAKMKSMDDKIDAILVAVAELGRGANSVEEVSEVEDTSPPGDEAGGA